MQKIVQFLVGMIRDCIIDSVLWQYISISYIQQVFIERLICVRLFLQVLWTYQWLEVKIFLFLGMFFQ